MGDSKFKAWLSAARPRTLTLAVASIAMGNFLAFDKGEYKGHILFLSILTTLLLQILSNLANDYGDYVNGADNKDRKGPDRAVQTGQISPKSMLKAVILFALLALVSGIVLLYFSFGVNLRNWLIFLSFGLISIGAAVNYTAGRNPYGYTGFGDISVFLFFGLLGTIGSYFLQTQQFNYPILFPAFSVGVFSVAVLNVNNMRDIESDKAAGKKTVAVRLGIRNARFYHVGLLLSGWVCMVVYSLLFAKIMQEWLFIVSLPFFLRNAIGLWREVNKDADEQQLDDYLKQTAQSTLIFVLLFGVGLVAFG